MMESARKRKKGSDQIRTFARRARSARKRFARVLKALERSHRGYVVAIEYESGRHVLGRTDLEAAEKAVKVFKRKPCHYFKIGAESHHHLYFSCRIKF